MLLASILLNALLHVSRGTQVMKTKILLIEDSESFANTVRLMLRGHPVEVVVAETGAQGIKAYRESIHNFATVIIDYCLPDLKGSEVALTLRKINPNQDFLFTSGYSEPEFLIDFLEVGGMRSFLFKDRPVEEIRSRILDSVSIYQTKNRIVGRDDYEPTKREAEMRLIGFVARSTAMYEIYEKIQKYKESPYPVLIVGETGTGKELIARALVPSKKNLIVVNCPRFVQSENLLEAELFGYVKGAFTGANADSAGLLSQVHDQVLFLDEFHQLSTASQAKLLRLLQEMRYRRVGDNSGREISINFKLIAAAKPEIYKMIENGQFLEDLLHRVGQLQIHVPPVRERLDDVEPLVRMIQDDFNSGKPIEKHRQLRASTVGELLKHPWTGNVRQLQSAIRQMLTDADGDIVNPPDFERFLTTTNSNTGSKQVVPLEESMRKFEVDQIISVLKNCRTQVEAAVKLGVNRSSFNRRLSQLGIDAENYLIQTQRKETIC